MTQCNPHTLHFANLDSRRLEADFSGGALTTDAGALLLREVDRRLGLLDALDHALPDPRDPERLEPTQRSLLAQRVFGLALGYEDLNDHQQLRHDPLWQLLAERTPDPTQPLASAPTLCRLENRVSRAALWRLAAVLVDQFVASFLLPPHTLVLDFDATDFPSHGQQQGRFFHGYYDNYCLLPLYVFCGEQLLVASLRPSNHDASYHAGAILQLLVQRLRQAWPDVKIVLRGDSGFCRWRLLRWCDHHGIGYLVGLARNPRLQRLAADWSDEAERRWQRTGQPQRRFGSFS